MLKLVFENSTGKTLLVLYCGELRKLNDISQMFENAVSNKSENVLKVLTLTAT